MWIETEKLKNKIFQSVLDVNCGILVFLKTPHSDMVQRDSLWHVYIHIKDLLNDNFINSSVEEHHFFFPLVGRHKKKIDTLK